MVSGSNFLCGILLARVLGLEAFGTYVVAQTYLLYANTFQAALVVAPMMTAVPTETNAAIRKTLLQGFLGYTVLVLVSTLILVQSVAAGLGAWSPAIGLGALALPLAGATVGFQLQDWSRRACYSEAKNHIVFWADGLAYLGQLACLLVLAATGKLSPVAAIWVTAATFSLSFIAVMVRVRLWPDRQSTTTVLRAHWRASKDFLASWQLQWLRSSGVILLGTGVVGTQAAGAIRAVQNLFGPVNVGFQWMDNVVPVRAAARLRSMGRGALSAYLWRIAVVGIAALGTFAILLALVDEPLIVLLYGEAYRPFAVLVVLQALYYLFGHVYRMASYFQRAISETKTLAMASAWWAAVALLTALLLVEPFVDRGIMAALVLGEVAGLIYLLTRHIKRPSNATHSVFRRGDGSVQLLLPLANLQLSHAALQMYYPSRWSGRLYRKALQWSLGARLAMRMAETHPPLATLYPHIDTVLPPDCAISPDCMGVLVSAPGPSSKLTIKLMDEQAKVLAYARLAYGAQAIAAIRREATVLQLLESTAVRAQVPKVLRQAVLTEPAAYCLVESAGPELASDKNLTTLHFEFLSQLLTSDTVLWSEVVDAMRMEVVSAITDTTAKATCMAACDQLQDSSIGEIPVCIEHGDFAPWNIRRTPSGDLFFIDWENATVRGLPWMDALHFVFQTSVLVNRQEPGRVVQALLNVFNAEVARVYVGRLTARKEHGAAFAVLYLLKALVLNIGEGHALDSKDQSARIAVLELLMKKLTIKL